MDDLKQFKYFIAIAEECNLSRAAEKLYVSQSSLSRYLLKLEAALNVKLFIRAKNNSLVITKAGEELLSCYRDVVYQLECCAVRISEDKKHSKKTILCGVTGELGISKISAILPQFNKQHPNTRIEFVIDSSSKLLEMLKDNKIDIVRCAYDEIDTSLKQVPIYRDRVNLFVSRQHPLATYTGSTISLSDIKENTFVLPNRNTVHRKILQRYFDKNNFDTEDIIEVPTNLSALAIVKAGIAIGLLQEEYADDGVCTIKIDPPLFYDICLIHRNRPNLSQDIEDFIQMCLDAVEKTTS